MKFALKTINLTALGPWVFRHCARPGQQLGLCVVPWPVRPPRDRADRADRAWSMRPTIICYPFCGVVRFALFCAYVQHVFGIFCAHLCVVKRDPDEGSFSRDGVTRELLLSHWVIECCFLTFADACSNSPPRTNNDTQQQVLDLLEQKCGGSESMPEAGSTTSVCEMAWNPWSSAIPVDMVSTVAWLVVLRDSRSHVDEAGIPGHDDVVFV